MRKVPKSNEDEVIAVFFDHAVQFRDLVRAVLKIGVHGDDHIALDDFKAFVECG